MSRLLVLGVAVAACAVAPASAQQQQQRSTRISPYIEASQILTSDLSNGGDVLTYSQLSAGVDAQVQTRRVEVQISYRYDRRFEYEGRLERDELHSGLARGSAVIANGLTIEGGAIATRARTDIRGDALGVGTAQGNLRNTSQVYSAYAGPNLTTHVGPMFVNGAYRFGYTKVDASGPTGVAPGQPAVDYFDDSTVHVATASVGVKSGTVLPVGVTVSGSYTREDAGQLDQRFEGKYGRGDVVLPVGRGVALAAGVGYEAIQISQRDPQRTVTGAPVVDGNGRFVTDPASPRRLAYEFDGIFWDAGVIWRPSRRTFLEARVGQRYGSWSGTGSFSYQMGPGSGIQVGVYDTVQTFGLQANGALAALPTSFQSNTDPFGNQFSGCILGTTGAATGGCLNQVFASTPGAAFRSRGITGVAVWNRGSNTIGLGGGYSRRTFLAPPAPAGGVSVDGLTDESIYAQAFASANVGRNGSLSASVFGSYYDTELAGAGGIFGWGANSGYTHQFGRLGATASLGIFGFDNEGASSAAAQALLGLRYGF